MKSTFAYFSFNTIDDVILDVKPHSFMATVDLQNAYRSVPINPDDRKHFGLRWDFGNGGPLTGGSQCHVSILRNNDVALSNLRNEHVTLSNLRNCHVPCHYLLKTHVACH